MGHFKIIVIGILISGFVGACSKCKMLGQRENPESIVIDREQKITKPKDIEIFKASIEQDVLKINFGDFSAGELKLYELKASMKYNKSNPPQLLLVLDDFKNEEEKTAEKAVFEKYFDLTTLKKAAKKDQPGRSEILLNINGKNWGAYSFE